MEGSAPDFLGTAASWLRCYRCWSQNLEVQVHYEGVLRVDPESGEAAEPVEEVQEAVVQCLDCLHDQPHLNLAFYEEDGRRVSRIEAVEDRWERMVARRPGAPPWTVPVHPRPVHGCSRTRGGVGRAPVGAPPPRPTRRCRERERRRDSRSRDRAPTRSCPPRSPSRSPSCAGCAP